MLNKIDHFIRNKKFKNRSHAVSQSVLEAIEKLEHNRLAIECAKLDPTMERNLADQGLLEDSKEWPEF